MNPWSYYLQESGYTTFKNSNPLPVKKYKWFAYKNGEAKSFDCGAAARFYSNLVEKVADQESIAKWKTYWDTLAEYQMDAQMMWKTDLQHEYENLSDDIFNLILDKAIYECHSNGYDSIVEKFETLAEFAEQILSLKK